MVYALRDPIGANLDRVQIIKGWLDAKGKTHEKVYDVAWSGGRKSDKNGKIPVVGNTVDVKNANWTNTIGAAQLGHYLEGPEFRSQTESLLLHKGDRDPDAALVRL